MTPPSTSPQIAVERAAAVGQIPILSGPMSEGIIQMRGQTNTTKHRNDSTERVCMFAVCLMFIGVPIIVLGIIMLTLFAPIGVILLMIGVVASTSGAFLAILSAILSVFMKTPDSVTTPANYADGKQVPEITIESTNYCENFDDNLCEQTSQQLSPKDLSNHTNDNNQDFTDKLDPVFWSNYPEAQNPKSYLNSFGDLPKIISSPEPSSQAGKSGKSGHKTFKDKYDDQIKRRISKTMKMGVKRKTISRTELTRDYSDDEITSSSSTSPSISPVNHKHSYYQMKANQYGSEPNESIITIENFHFNVNTTDDNNESESASAVCSTPDVIFAHKSSADENTTEDNSDYTTTNHSNVSHKTDKTNSSQVLSESNDKQSIDKIEFKNQRLNEENTIETQIQNSMITGEDDNNLTIYENIKDIDMNVESNFSNLWTNIRESNK